MSTVELVVTETRVWARGATTHCDVLPSIGLSSNGFDLMVGQPLTPPTLVSSAVQFIPADAIALTPRAPSVVDGLSAVFAAVLENLGVAVPCERIILVCPTDWGSPRRSVLDQAARGFAADVAFEDMAVRSVAVDEGTSHSSRTVVLEFGTLTTTASAVIRDHHGIHIESCEHEPTLALAEITAESRAFDDLCALIDRLLGERPVDLAQVVGVSDPVMLELLGTAVQQTAGTAVEVRGVVGPDLIRSRRPEPAYPRDAAPTLTPTEWMQPLRDRAAAQRPSHHRTTSYIAAVAVVAVVVVAVVAGVILLGRSNDTATTAGIPTTSAASEPTARTLPPASTASAPETFGRISFQLPTGWRIVSAPGDGKSRIDLAPEDGSRHRMTVVQTTLVRGSGYEQVVANLEAQMAQRPNGALSDVTREVVFGGRSGLAYTERPRDGSTVRWHVFLEYGIQVSVGCQYVGESWLDLSNTCERFGSSVRVIE
ncbi:type VII secretion-associated protein [Nocardia sp. NBC_00881]|uniref:type VII secretion-associated protein n=1 Tax=Nocardia sp. NBC_00881 TaxID=2975995 RepID=UPI00386CB9A5|nr:type VII secretion-associated protein [Nocardia sp. NBC_00881]